MFGSQLWIVTEIALVVASMFVALLSVLRKKKPHGGKVSPPFRRRDYLLSKAERAFFDVLQRAVKEELLIFAKVRMEDLVWLPKGTRNRQGWQNKVRQKHVDFVLCDASRIGPVLVIELDDASHKRDEARARDGDKDRILEAAGLPLVRVRAKGSYDVRELAELIERSRLKLS